MARRNGFAAAAASMGMLLAGGAVLSAPGAVAWGEPPAASGVAAPDGPAPSASAAPQASAVAPQAERPSGRLRVEIGDRGDHPKDPPVVAIAVPVAFFATVIAIVAISLYASFRKDQQRHATLRLVIERGGSIPPELLTPAPKRPASDLRRGVVLLAAGVGLTILLAAASSERGLWTAGLVPVLLGLGYLVVWRLEARGMGDAHGANRTPDALG